MRARKDARSGEAPGWRFQMSGDVNSGDGINGVCMTDHSIFMPTANYGILNIFNSLWTIKNQSGIEIRI
jgi:hypothetical protein